MDKQLNPCHTVQLPQSPWPENAAIGGGRGVYSDRVLQWVYIHFGPWSLRSSVTSVLFLRTELTEDRSD